MDCVVSAFGLQLYQSADVEFNVTEFPLQKVRAPPAVILGVVLNRMLTLLLNELVPATSIRESLLKSPTASAFGNTSEEKRLILVGYEL